MQLTILLCLGLVDTGNISDSDLEEEEESDDSNDNISETNSDLSSASDSSSGRPTKHMKNDKKPA